MNNTRGAGRTDIRVVRNLESKTETIPETPIEYFATCPKGFEQLLAEELKRLRAKRVRPLKSGVAFFGTQRDGYRVCLWSRIASRVLRVIGRVDAHDAETFYQGVKDFRGKNSLVFIPLLRSVRAEETRRCVIRNLWD